MNHMSVVEGLGRTLREGERRGEGGEEWDQEGRTCTPGAGAGGPAWQDLGPRTLYIWGRGAGGLSLPPNTAFHVEGGEGRRLVLQVHYKAGSRRSRRTGVVITYTEQEVEGWAGVLSLHAGGFLPPLTSSTLETSCPLLGRQPLQPLALLVHTHHLGVWAGLWREGVEGEQELGRASPQEPQKWRHIGQTRDLEQRDRLVARCLLGSFS